MVSLPWKKKGSLPDTVESLDDLKGEFYVNVLKWLHAGLDPKAYLEIGTRDGRSLSIATCPSVAIDPNFILKTPDCTINKPFCGLYKTTSDDYFASNDPKVALGRPLDFAFLDGMHQCEFLLRDFMNTEQHCHAKSVIALHDCLPVEFGITVRDMQAKHAVVRPHRETWWAGDVWRTARALQQFRPDLRLTVLNAAATGLVLVDRLDPTNRVLFDRYDEIVATMMGMELEQTGLAGHYAQMKVEPTSLVDTPEKIRARYLQ